MQKSQRITKVDTTEEELTKSPTAVDDDMRAVTKSLSNCAILQLHWA
jgi:hypothetical protein